jgi:ATP synthase protein I
MATGNKPEKDTDLAKRSAELDAALSSMKRERVEAAKGMNSTGNMNGMAYALRLSSEFIAAILVGTAIGWLIDKMTGSSPWGLIVFLMLGFVAGILNVLRSAGLIAVPKSERGTDWKPSAQDTTPPGNAWKDDEEDR